MENAIVLCLRCHGEAGHYNPRHSIGNKYSPEELRRHRDEWWEWCHDNPAAPLPRLPISVSPGTVNLGSGEWRGRSTIKLHNKTDDVYYQIWVKVTFEQEDLPTDKVTITPSESSLRSDLEVELGKVWFNSDVLRVDCEDETGRNAVLLQLYSLDPGDTYTFVIKNELADAREDRVRAFVTVCGFEKEPASVSESGERGAVSVRPPETITVRSVSLLVKRAP